MRKESGQSTLSHSSSFIGSISKFVGRQFINHRKVRKDCFLRLFYYGMTEEEQKFVIDVINVLFKNKYRSHRVKSFEHLNRQNKRYIVSLFYAVKINWNRDWRPVMNKLKNKIYPYAYLYIWVTFICLLTVFFYICVNGGSVLAQWFFVDTRDTGNDFFNCIPAVKGYGLGYSLLEQYPPLAKLFFLLMAHIYSYNNIPLDTTIRNSMTDPRMQQAALVPFIIFVLFTSLIIVVIVEGMFKEEKQSVLFGASIIGTYSVLFAIERGNIIFISFMFLMYFIAYYQSENRVFRETAFIALAVSAGLKLYPAAFGVLLIYEKRWKEAIRTIIYGILALFIPNIMIKQYLPQNGSNDMANIIVGYANELLSRLFGVRPLQQQIFIMVSIVIALIGMVFIGIRGNEHWMNVFYAGVLAIICGVMFAYPYAYVFLIPSLVLFIKEEKILNFRNCVYFILLCILNLPLPIFGAIEHMRLSLLGEIKMWVLFVMIILVILLELPMFKKVKESKE